jgi:TPR repeat protein
MFRVFLFIFSFLTSQVIKANCTDIVNAAWEGKTNIVISLLESGTDPNCTHKGVSALVAAARYGRSWQWDENIHTVQSLVEYGADINKPSKGKDGKLFTPAYIAAFAGHTKTAVYLVSMGASFEDVKKGHTIYAQRERQSLDILEILAGLGDSFLKSTYGIDIDSDNNIKGNYKDTSTAFLSQINSALSDNVSATVGKNMFLVGAKFYKKGNFRLAQEWLSKSADNGFVEAYLFLAEIEKKEPKTAESQSKIFKYLMEAAKLGNVEAQYEIGVLYSSGQGVSMSENQAIHWFEKAANQGNELAQRELATMYEFGTSGLQKSNKDAIYWYIKAASQGEPISQFRLGRYYIYRAYLFDQGIDVSVEKGLSLFESSCNSGYSNACNEISNINK